MKIRSTYTTLEEFQNYFLSDERYREWCKRIYKRLGDVDYKRSNDVQKNTMCFLMALLFRGISKKSGVLSGECGLLFEKEIALFSAPGSWMRQAGGFFRNGKNGELDIPQDDHRKMKELRGNITIAGAVDWFFEESEIEIGNNKDKGALRNSVQSMVKILIDEMKFEGMEYSMGTADSMELLKANKQLIMNGAPGTGKTYAARNEIADKLLGISGKPEAEKDRIKKIQMDMVQFHPSYDYTDFIEGIRPNLEGMGVGYTLKNGSFKKFCRRAGVIERIVAAGEVVGEETIEKFLQGEDDEIVSFWKEEIKKEAFDNTQLPPFLFIIDEINRAEISKVLGETMFCLDADYRGEKGRIATQYSSLATDESFFIDKKNDKFFIPSNVYIIGTMNDIDRSVEVFDFALRRRFAWQEVKAEDVMETVLKEMQTEEALGNNYIDYLGKIEELNQSIDSMLKLNRHYHLGPSYFAKIKLYSAEQDYKSAREDVWNNHISQILNEYVKGKRTESEIEKIGEAFKA